MKRKKIRLLVLATLLTAATLPWAAPDAEAACTRICWQTIEGACCRISTCEIIC